MSRRPVPTPIYHFTHVANLPGIIREGPLSDAECRERGATEVEIGAVGIKERRRRRLVPAGPSGYVGDYAPFYYAPLSPMMSRLKHEGRSLDDVVYLVSTLDALDACGCPWVASDRNAALNIAAFIDSSGPIDDHVDWELMDATWWNNTAEFPDRKERRMAECLVHRVLPWDAVTRIVTKTEATKADVELMLESMDVVVEIVVRADWYF